MARGSVKTEVPRLRHYAAQGGMTNAFCGFAGESPAFTHDSRRGDTRKGPTSVIMEAPPVQEVL